MNATASKNLIDSLVGSELYREYERAFSEATGLPVVLRPADSWQLAHHGQRRENPFCSRMAGRSRSCAACLQTQQKLSDRAVEQPRTVSCPTGLSDSAVPVRLGERVIGFLQTGQIFRKAPTEAQFERTARLLVDWGLGEELAELKRAYFATRVLPPRQHAAVVKMLMIFAQHLSLISNQLVVRHENAEPVVVRRAKDYIHEHQGEDLSLSQVARAVNTSSYYFCKLFKRVSGLNFTDYVSRVRIEKARNLLLNPNLRISEIAFEVGFQSLTHFNRVFKRIIGQSPTQYRSQLPAG